MGIAENKKIVLDFLALLYAHRIDDAFRLVADDGTWWMAGTLPVSGTYTKAQVQQIFHGVRDRFVDAPEMRITSVTAEEDRVAVEVEGRGRLHCGFEYHNHYHMLFRVRDGRIASCRNHQDLNHIREMMEAEQAAA
jgi:ketosteroid isomerase-like protein